MEQVKDKPKDTPRPNKLMQEKLKNAQTLLEGLATNDFDKIKDCAQELIRISKAAEFAAYKTPMYEVHTNNFRRAAETIVQKAKDKNIDGATLAYVDMTLTCIRCHEHCREVRDTSLPGRED
jgi:7-cyano-7-deazaguanine synthase in queuosine biosynthesis